MACRAARNLRDRHRSRARPCRTRTVGSAPTTPAGLSRRVRAVLLMAQGVSGVEVAERVGYTVVQVSRLRRRFAEEGLPGLHERPRSGRPPTITARQRARVVALTLKPPGH